jgi:6-phosphofructokinase 2
VVSRLGGGVTALFTAGGCCGELLKKLVCRENIRSLVIPIEDETREDFTVLDTSIGNEFRFVSKGPYLSEAEWRRCLEVFTGLQEPFDFLVVSGSLPPGVPDDFDARIAEAARKRGLPFALDTSGASLKAALEHGAGLIKPNLREMCELVGEPLPDRASRVAACRALVESGKTDRVALTLGQEGALLVTREGSWFARPLPIERFSTVGAGDSFLGAMVYGLASGLSECEAFRQGVAAGSAALLASGTGLAHAADVSGLVKRVEIEPAC